MVKTVEYRICMPFTVDEYKIGQLYMIARHSFENTTKSEGIQVIKNEPFEDPVHGLGQYTEKRIHVGGSLPSWIQALIPRFFYVTEKAWNTFPYTATEYTCSFLPRFSVGIRTVYENNRGTNDKALPPKEGEVPPEVEVALMDIANDPVPEKHKHECPDLKAFKSEKTGRGPLVDNWRERISPMMCSYKLVTASFGVWGLQTKVENFVQRVVRDVLIVGHIQAFAWIDEWHGMTLDTLREYEARMQAEANKKLGKVPQDVPATDAP